MSALSCTGRFRLSGGAAARAAVRVVLAMALCTAVSAVSTTAASAVPVGAGDQVQASGSEAVASGGGTGDVNASSVVRTPVYQSYNRTNLTYLYTADENEVSYIRARLSGVYSGPGAVFYAEGAADLDTIRVWRFRDRRTEATLLTARQDEHDLIAANRSSIYEDRGVVFHVHESARHPELVPVHDFYMPAVEAHLYTANPIEAYRILTEVKAGASTYQYSGVAFYAEPYARETSYSRPTVTFDDRYRFNGPLDVSAQGGLSSNDVDLDRSEIVVSPGRLPKHGTLTLREDGSFRYTPQAGFVGDDDFTYTVTDDGHTDVATVLLDGPGTPTVVHRFYNFRKGTHFYTADEAEKTTVSQTLRRTFSYDGPAYVFDSTSRDAAQPLHRFYNLRNGTHFYTASEQEKTTVSETMGRTFRYEGPAYYVSPKWVPGATTVHRFYNFRTGVHFYTASEQERSDVSGNLRATFRYEGPAFYLPQ